MSKQPSERAFDVASEWHGHQLKCAIFHAPGRDDADCTCNVRDLALAIDAAMAAAREEAYEKCIALARNSGYHALAAEIPRAEVVRVLAGLWKREVRVRRTGPCGGGGLFANRTGLFACITDIADALQVRPEFDSALAAQEARDGK